MSYISVASSGQQNYLAGVVVAKHMLDSALIDERDYAVLEMAFAEKFRPLFRYETPCFSFEKAITLEHTDCIGDNKERSE